MTASKNNHIAHVERAIDTTFMYTGQNHSINRNYSSLFLSTSINNSELESPDNNLEKKNKKSE